ncbi:MAG: hypothetical protein FJ296_05160 [Planctomycetes bacterium]|nr:hypothetical protein [Planctomycetota bacterium]
MNTHRILLASSLLLLAGSAVASPNVQSTRLFLTRPVSGAPDLDATGSVLVRSYDGGDRERFDLRIHNVLPEMVHELWVADETDTLVLVAELEGGKSKKYSVDTDDGETLPLGLTLAELAGRRIEVQADSQLLLQSVVPTFVDDAQLKSATEILDVATGSPNLGAQGKLFVKANDKQGLQFLRLKAKDLGFQSFSYTLWIDDGEGTMVEVGSIEQYGKRKGRFVSNTRSGKPLPLGVLYLSDIVGRTIEVRNNLGEAILDEKIPPLAKG